MCPEGLFSPFWPPKLWIFLLRIKFPIDGLITQKYSFEGPFSPIWPPKALIFFFYIKFLIDGYMTRPFWFWAPNSVFGLWGLIFVFSTPKMICFLDLYRNFDRLMGCITCLIFEPPSAQPREPADSKFFRAKNTQKKSGLKLIRNFII
jgi:hypothetical protein